MVWKWQGKWIRKWKWTESSPAGLDTGYFGFSFLFLFSCAFFIQFFSSCTLGWTPTQYGWPRKYRHHHFPQRTIICCSVQLWSHALLFLSPSTWYDYSGGLLRFSGCLLYLQRKTKRGQPKETMIQSMHSPLSFDLYAHRLICLFFVS